MKSKSLTIIAAIIFLALIVIVSAYPVQIKLNANTNFNSTVYKCSNSDCSSLASLTPVTSNYGNPILYSLTGSGNQYFAEYDFVPDRCAVSHSYITNTTDSTGAGPWNYDIQFAKQANCQSKINYVIAASQIYDNESFEVNVSFKSPLNLNPNGPQRVPSALSYFYSTNSSLDLTIKNASQPTQILSYVQVVSDILWGTNRTITLPIGSLPAGVYNIEATSDVNDCMCSSSITSTYPSITLTVLSSANQSNQTNQTNQSDSRFNISIISPTISQQINVSQNQTTALIPLILNVTGNTTNFACNYSINGNLFACPALNNGQISSFLNVTNGTNILIINASNSNYTWNTLFQFDVLFNITNGTIITNNTCTSFTYSSWGDCQSSGIQTRTVLTSLPAGCVGGNPITSRSCNYDDGDDDGNHNKKKSYNASAVTINYHDQIANLTTSTVPLEFEENQRSSTVLWLSIILLILSIILAIVLIYLLMK